MFRSQYRIGPDQATFASLGESTFSVETGTVIFFVDMHFYMSNRERAQNDAAVKSAVEAAFDYIAKRLEKKSGGFQVVNL